VAPGLFNLIKSIPPTLKYEPGMIVAEIDFVIVQGRFSGIGQPVNWIAAEVLRIKDGIPIELSRTKPPKSSQRAAVPCSETSSQSENET
jgi:hypothetical protein